MDGQRDRRGWGGGVEERNQKEESTWAADTGKLLHARNLDYRPGPLLFLLGVRGTVPEQTAIKTGSTKYSHTHLSCNMDAM